MISLLITGNDYKELLLDAERQVYRKAYLEAEGNISKAAKSLNVSRTTFYNVLKRHSSLRRLLS